jgi:hypothetical protein
MRSFLVSNWSTHKERIRRAYDVTAMIHEDNDRRLWLSERRGTIEQHYVEVVMAGRACAAEIEMRGADGIEQRRTVEAIVNSVGIATPPSRSGE